MYWQDYHPSRVLTLVYQPFAFVTMVLCALHEEKMNTRRRILFGYILFFLSTFGLLLVCSALIHRVSILAASLVLVIISLSFLALIDSCTWHEYPVYQIDLGTSGKGGIPNYIGICVLVSCFGLADASVQGGIVGDLAFMHPEFNQVKAFI